MQINVFCHGFATRNVYNVFGMGNKNQDNTDDINNQLPVEFRWGLVASMVGGLFGGTAIVGHEAQKMKMIKWNEIAQKWNEPYIADLQQAEDFWQKALTKSSRIPFSPFNHSKQDDIGNWKIIREELKHSLDDFFRNEAVLYYIGSALVAGVVVGASVHVYNKIKPENQIISNEATNEKLSIEQLDVKIGS